MTKIAFISDLHADIASLDAALAHIRRLGCDRVMCAGDLVDGDVFADEVIARLMAEGIPCIRGNHDRWALENAGVMGGGDGGRYGSGAELSAESLRFLAGLPTHRMVEVEGVRIAVWHASVGSDMAGVDPRGMTEEGVKRLVAKAGRTSWWWGTRRGPNGDGRDWGNGGDPGAL